MLRPGPCRPVPVITATKGVSVLVLCGLLSVGAQAQERDRTDAPMVGVQSFPGLGASSDHPATVARRYWEELELTEAQFSEMEAIEGAFGALVFRYAMEAGGGLVGPDFWWEDSTLTEEAARDRVLATVEREVALLLGLAESRERVYGALRPEQADRLRALVRASYEQRLAGVRSGQGWPDPSADAPTRACVSGSVRGAVGPNDRVTIHFAARMMGDSASIENVRIARGEGPIPSMAQVPPRPEGPGEFLSGGPAGRWHLLFDAAENTAWVHDRPVPLGDANVVLITGIDRLHEAPEVQGLVRVPPVLYTGGCADGSRIGDHLVRHLMGDAVVRRFIEGG